MVKVIYNDRRDQSVEIDTDEIFKIYTRYYLSRRMRDQGCESFEIFLANFLDQVGAKRLSVDDEDELPF